MNYNSAGELGLTVESYRFAKLCLPTLALITKHDEPNLIAQDSSWGEQPKAKRPESAQRVFFMLDKIHLQI